MAPIYLGVIGEFPSSLFITRSIQLTEEMQASEAWEQPS